MKRFATMLLTATLLAVPMAGIQIGPAASQEAPKSADSGTMERADADMRNVLMKLQELNPKPLAELSAAEARRQPTPADAVAEVLKAQGKDPAQMKAQSGVSTQDVTYPGAAGGEIPARIYKPENAAADLPVILYIHGGGWVIADLDTYDATPRALAKKANAIVASVHYRQAPEHKFPAAHDDINAAYDWMLKNAQSWGGNPQKAVIVGESAGGNMAITAAMAARDKNLTAPLHVVAVYPVAGTNLDTQSYMENENAKPLNKAAMRWFFDNTVQEQSDLSDPRLDLVKAVNLNNLPPVTIITAEIDPLRSEGTELAERIKAAGGQATARNFEGVTHEFFGMDAVVQKAAEAQDFAVEQIKEDLLTTSSN